MKRLLTYTLLTVLVCCLSNSCIQDKFSTESLRTSPEVILNLSMPSSSNTRANSTQDDYKANGTEKECTIKDASDIRIFAFNSYDDTFFAPVQDLTFKASKPGTYTLTGKLSNVALGMQLKLVVMANFGYYNSDPVAPTVGTKFNDWAKTLVFAYKGSTSDEQDRLFMPMTGIAEVYINRNPNHKNSVQLFLKRSIAKVKISIAKNCTESLENISLLGSRDLSYCFSDGHNVNIPNGFKSSERTFTNVVSPSKSLVFYITEQLQDMVTITFNFQSDDIQHSIHFKNYTDGQYYPIERNYVYEFVIGKKGTETVDISTNIQPWTVINLDTEYI